MGYWPSPLGTILLGVGIWIAIQAVRLRQQLRRRQVELCGETAHRQVTETALGKARERYHDLFEHVSIGLFQSTVDGKLIRVNGALAASAGYSSVEEMLAAVTDATQEFHIPEFCTRGAVRASVIDETGDTERPTHYETLIRQRTGDYIVAAVSLRLVCAEAGSYLEGCVVDITERVRALEFADAQRDLGIQLSAASSMASALPLCLNAAIRASGMEGGEIYLWDRENGPLLAEGRGLRPECLRSMCLQAEMTTALLEPIDDPVYAPNQQCEVGHARGCEQPYISRAIIPIRHEGARIGWLVMRSHQLNDVPPFTRTALETISAQMGSAIARLQAQEALSASQRELRTLFDSLTDFLMIVDLRGRIVDGNRALIERSGYSRQELQGMCITKLYPLRLELGGAGGLLGGELNFLAAPLVAKDGTVIPVETRLGIGTWERQSVIIGLGRDLTERRKAEEQTASLREKTALLKEIHHRVKNNLQIICSLLSLQSNRMEPGTALDAFRESQARIRAIALLHEKLYQSKDLSRVELGEYLGALAQEVVRTYNHSSQAIQFHLDADPIRLNQDTVMPCGLVVNELVTNACKYAFPEGREGEVHLSVKTGPENTLQLTLKDNGVGLPASVNPRKTTTLGLQLVDDMVAQLKGSWTIERSGGTVFQIVFPAEKI